MDQSTFVEDIIAPSIQVNTGDVFTITATEGLSDHARVDYIDFVPVAAPTSGGSSFDTYYNQAVSEIATALGQTEEWVGDNLGTTDTTITEDLINDVQTHD